MLTYAQILKALQQHGLQVNDWKWNRILFDLQPDMTLVSAETKEDSFLDYKLNYPSTCKHETLLEAQAAWLSRRDSWYGSDIDVRISAEGKEFRVEATLYTHGYHSSRRHWKAVWQVPHKKLLPHLKEPVTHMMQRKAVYAFEQAEREREKAWRQAWINSQLEV